MSRADVVGLGASAVVLTVFMHAVGATRPISLLAPVAFGLSIALLPRLVTASDTLAEVVGAVGMLTTLSGLLSLVARRDRHARRQEVRVRWRQFERAFRRYVAEPSDLLES